MVLFIFLSDGEGLFQESADVIEIHPLSDTEEETDKGLYMSILSHTREVGSLAKTTSLSSQMNAHVKKKKD